MSRSRRRCSAARGDDIFEVFRNVATLNLYGDAGDDTFVIRSFVGESELTALNAGEGRNFIQYASNAPVNIDGGSGYDLVVIIGTEFNDTFVITSGGVYGAGRVIRFVNVEKVSIYGMEGDDVFHVLSTNPASSCRSSAGSAPTASRSAAPRPRCRPTTCSATPASIRHSVESTVANSAWALLPVDGIATEIMDNDEPTVVVAPVGGSLVLTEGGAPRSVTVRLTQTPLTAVQVTLVGPAIDPTSTSRARYIELSIDDGATWRTSVTLDFAAGDTAQRTVLVRAIADLAAEGEWFAPIDAIVTGGDYAGALVATTFVRVLDDDTPEVPVVIARRRHPRDRAGNAAGIGGTTAAYEVRITSTPLGTGHRAGHRARPACRSRRTAPRGSTSADSDVSPRAGAQTVQVRAIDDAIVEGQHVQAITAVDHLEPTVASGTVSRRRRPGERVRVHRLRRRRRRRSRASSSASRAAPARARCAASGTTPAR